MGLFSAFRRRYHIFRGLLMHNQALIPPLTSVLGRRAAVRLALAFLVTFSGCAVTNYNPNNIIDITDEQYLEDGHGNRCLEREMIITPDSIRYSYPGCSVTRVVKTKPHILPTPSPKLN